MPDDTFILGVNYWPPNKAMYWWKEFDRGEVDEQFAQIAEYGLRVVRFFLLWEDFQPEIDRISSTQLDNLRTVLDIAQRHGVSAVPTLLVGNMSGVMWFPPFAFTDQPEHGKTVQISGGRPVHRQLRSPFSDPGMLRAEVALAIAAAGALRGHPALHSWDLANEIDQAYLPEGPDAGWLWAWTLRQAIRSSDPDVEITYGAHHLSLVTNGLTVPALAPSLDYLAMHGYPIYSEVARGPMDTEFVPFITTLTAALGKKPALMQEFGLPTTPAGEPSHTIEDDFLGTSRSQFMASEEDDADYHSRVLDRLWQTGALGALAWDYADYDASLFDRPPLRDSVRERTFGLFRADLSAKPVAEVVRRFAGELHSGALPGRLGAHGAGRVDLQVDGETYYRDPPASMREAYKQYLNRLDEQT